MKNLKTTEVPCKTFYVFNYYYKFCKKNIESKKPIGTIILKVKFCLQRKLGMFCQILRSSLFRCQNLEIYQWLFYTQCLSSSPPKTNTDCKIPEIICLLTPVDNSCFGGSDLVPTTGAVMEAVRRWAPYNLWRFRWTPVYLLVKTVYPLWAIDCKGIYSYKRAAYLRVYVIMYTHYNKYVFSIVIFLFGWSIPNVFPSIFHDYEHWLRIYNSNQYTPLFFPSPDYQDWRCYCPGARWSTCSSSYRRNGWRTGAITITRRSTWRARSAFGIRWPPRNCWC